MLLLWAGYVAVPTKKDALIIIAGGTMGNFMQSDTSVQKLPKELIWLVRTKIQEEIKNTDLQSVLPVQDTLVDKTKEELIQKK